MEKETSELAEVNRTLDRVGERLDRSGARLEYIDRELDKLLISQSETDRKFQETDKYIKETSRMLREHGKHIGGLGKKFGDYTEGLAFPSIEKILRKKYQTDSFATNLKHTKKVEHIEIDALAFSNSDKNLAIVIEIKSILKDEHIEQVKSVISRFKKHFPGYKNFTIYGMIISVNAKKDVIDKAFAEGLLVGTVSDLNFRMRLPRGFKPKEF